MIRVWAPNAAKVSLALYDQCITMARIEGGWWESAIEVPFDADYGFYLDEYVEPIPDPRSAWQPNGVHGFSRRVDHSAFLWTDAGWQSKPLSAAIIYELHAGTFTPAGTFEAVADKLDHLLTLGVTHIELMPVAEFAGRRGWGYDGVNMYAPHHSYGGPIGLKRLVNECHRRGMGVILDVVYNHLGPEGNYLDRFGPYHSDRYHTLWGPAMNFDGVDSPEVRNFICDNALMWLRDYHMDGLRLDDTDAFYDRSAFSMIEEITERVADLGTELGRHFFIIGESNLNNPRLVRPIEYNGFGLDAVWNDEFHHALHVTLTDEHYGYYVDYQGLESLVKIFHDVFLLDRRYSMNRRGIHGRPAGEISGHRYVAYSQTHDQIGNRAQGDRLCHLVSTGLCKIAAALVMTSPYVPMLFQGEEWAASTPFLYFTDFSKLELSQAVSEGRKKSLSLYGWKPEEVADPELEETFERSRLKWEELGESDHQEMLSWYMSLIRLRREIPALKNGHRNLITTGFDADEKWFWVRRGPVLTACNFSHQLRKISLPTGDGGTIRLASNKEARVSENSLELPPESVAIIAG